MSEGDAPQFLIPPVGYINSTTPFYYPQPQITSVNPLPLEIYISPDGSDAPGVVGSVTAPFATITNAIGYVNALPGAVTSTSVACFFVAPGTYAGAVQLTDNMFLIGATINSTIPSLPTQVVNAVIISDLVTVTGNYSNDQPILIQNIQLDGGVRVRSVFFDTALNLVNCALRTPNVSPALDIDPADQDVVSSVSSRNCLFSTDSGNNLALVRAPDSENTFLTFDGCQFSTYAEEGSIIDIIGSLTLNNCTLTNYQTGATLSPLIILSSGANLAPELVITNSTLKYTDVSTVDTGGDKLAVRFNAPTQPITATVTGCSISIFLGDSQTDIIKNVGAQNVTLSQSANSCLSDGKTIDATNIVLTAAHFLQDSPMPPGPGAGVESLNTLTGDITITGENGVSIGGSGGNITISGSGVTSLAGLTGALTFSSPDDSININPSGSDIELTSNFPAIPVASVGGKTGDVTFSPGDAISIGYGENNAAPITISNLGVHQLEGVNGVITLSGTNVAITVADQDIAFEVTFPVDTVGGKTGTVAFEAGDGIAIGYGIDNAAPINIANSGVLTVTAGTGITLSGDTPQNPTIDNTGVLDISGVSGVVTLSGTNVTITTASQNIDFEVTFPVDTVGGKTGAVALAAGGGIDISGGATNADPITISNTGVLDISGVSGVVTLSGTNVTITTAGQNIDFQVSFPTPPVSSVGGKTGTVAFAAGSGITLDYGATNADPITINQGPPIVVQAAGTTALTSANRNTIFILTSGTTQDFTTLTLDIPQAGHVWYVKNAKASGDITIEWNAAAIVGFATVHPRTMNNNSSMQILYWDGADLFIY